VRHFASFGSAAITQNRAQIRNVRFEYMVHLFPISYSYLTPRKVIRKVTYGFASACDFVERDFSAPSDCF